MWKYSRRIIMKNKEIYNLRSADLLDDVSEEAILEMR